MTTMALTPEEFCNPPPQGSSHTQESGQAGFSANLTHTFSDCSENLKPITIKGSSVRPIHLQDEQTFCEVALVPEEVESHRENTVTVECSLSFLKESVNKGNLRVATPQLRRAALTKTERNIYLNPSTNKHRMIPPRRKPGRKREIGGRRSTRKSIRTTVAIGFFMAAVLLPDCASSSDFNCFTCNHSDCKTIHSIYGENDELLYQSPLHNDTRTGCSRDDVLPNSCLPCIDKFPVIIPCSSNLTHIKVEADHGVLEVFRGCEQEQTSSPGGSHHNHCGLIASGVLFLVVDGILVFTSLRASLNIDV